MGDHDRDAILARRALLISAALASFACTSHEAPTEPEPASPVDSGEPAPPVVVETPGVGPGQTAPSDGTRPAWAEVMAKVPPLDVPPGLSPSETERLTNLADYARDRYVKLAELWSALPGCGPSDPSCEAWTHAIEVLDGINPEDWGPMCGYSAAITHAIIERGNAHTRYIRQLSDLLLADLDAAIVARGNPADSAAWVGQREADKAYGRPCLSCAMPTAEPIVEAVPFAADAASLAQSDEVTRVLERARLTHEYNRQQSKAKLIIRGHADPGEANPEALAQQRAEAVAAALVGLGINRKQLEVRGYGATLLLTRDPGEADANRRVDFEVVVP